MTTPVSRPSRRIPPARRAPRALFPWLTFLAALLFSASVSATVIPDRQQPTCDIAKESTVMRDQRNQRLNRAVTWDRPWKLQSMNDTCIRILTNAVITFSPTVGTFGAWFYTPIAVAAVNTVVKDVCGDIKKFYTSSWNRTLSRAKADILNSLNPDDEPGYYTGGQLGYDTPSDRPATLPTYQCSDRIDNDGDGQIDFPNDVGCDSLYDDSEGDGSPPPPTKPACSDGIDNDNDGLIDYPNDPGCLSPDDVDESNAAPPPPKPQCSDGIDNDGDGLIDYPRDPGCSSANDDREQDDTPPVERPACSDGRDNDLDGLVDYPADPGCSSPDDNSETGEPPQRPQCSDGIDNDYDGRIDYPNDPDCSSPQDNSESTIYACQDGIDNDGDGLIDYPNDPGCSYFTDDTEEDGVPNSTNSVPFKASPNAKPAARAPAAAAPPTYSITPQFTLRGPGAAPPPPAQAQVARPAPVSRPSPIGRPGSPGLQPGPSPLQPGQTNRYQ